MKLPRRRSERPGTSAGTPVGTSAGTPVGTPVGTPAAGLSAAARSALRRRPAVPFTMRRRQRSRGGPLVFALVLVAGFVGAAFAVGYLVGRLLL